MVGGTVLAIEMMNSDFTNNCLMPMIWAAPVAEKLLTFCSTKVSEASWWTPYQKKQLTEAGFKTVFQVCSPYGP